jgi:hypothetical protein
MSDTAPAACAIRALVVKVQSPRHTNAAWLGTCTEPNPKKIVLGEKHTATDVVEIQK